jgi:hypothetical protein
MNLETNDTILRQERIHVGIFKSEVTLANKRRIFRTLLCA